MRPANLVLEWYSPLSVSVTKAQVMEASMTQRTSHRALWLKISRSQRIDPLHGIEGVAVSADVAVMYSTNDGFA